MFDERRETTRVPHETPVSIQLADLGQFLEEYSANISLGGMFIKTAGPLPPGTIFKFRFSLTGDVTVISGTAEVTWVRDEDAGSEAPRGMGVRFIELEDLSRDIILRVVDLYIQQGGGQPFEIGGP